MAEKLTWSEWWYGLLSKPWRETPGWNERDNLKETIAGLDPNVGGDIQVPRFKIVLTGLIGAGKSSFFNSISSIYRGHVVTSSSQAGSRGKSLTQEYFEYQIKNEGGKPLAFSICDTMGLTSEMNEVDVNNILQAVDGHVPSGHEFERGQRFDCSSSGYIENPTIADMAHCVAFVVDAKTAKQIEEKAWENVQCLWRKLIKRKIPIFFLLTHIDEECEHTRKETKNVYRSPIIKDLVNFLSTNLWQIPGNQIYPVINYKNQTELKNDIDFLLLYALRQMLYAAQASLDNK